MDFKKYVYIAEMPTKARFTTTFWYRDGKCVCTQRPGESLAEGFDTTDCVSQQKFDDYTYKQALAEYRLNEGKLREKFKVDLFQDLMIENHPMREKLFEIAWGIGRRDLPEVYHYANMLSELIEPPAGTVIISKNAVIWGPNTCEIGVEGKAAELQEALAK